MKTYGVEVQFHAFVTSAQGGGWWSAHEKHVVPTG